MKNNVTLSELILLTIKFLSNHTYNFLLIWETFLRYRYIEIYLILLALSLCTIVKRERQNKKNRKNHFNRNYDFHHIRRVRIKTFSYSYNFKIARDFSVFIKNICIFKAFHLLNHIFHQKNFLSNATLLHEIDKDKLWWLHDHLKWNNYIMLTFFLNLIYFFS